MPKVSVVIPTYNSARYVTAAVESVLAQTFTDYELLVVDDGSTDNTGQLLRQYEGKLTYIYQENQERSVARNTGIRASSGEYLAFLDADDVWFPEKLEHQVAVLDEHPEVALVFCQAVYIDASGNPVRFRGQRTSGDDEAQIIIGDRSRDLFCGDIVSGGGSTAIVRRSLLNKVGLFDETLNYPEDWDLWLRLSHQGLFAYIPRPLAYYRVYGWPRILSFEASERILAQHIRVIEKAAAVWPGDTAEAEWLRAKALATVYIRAALASFQLGNGPEGLAHLEKAIGVAPELAGRDRLMHLAVDRAKLIETETGSFQEARAFVRIFFDNLPPDVAQFNGIAREAVGWLYIGGAFEKFQHNDKAATRRLLAQGVMHAPGCLKNRGVVSLALHAWLGDSLAGRLRKVGSNIIGFTGDSVDAKS